MKKLLILSFLLFIGTIYSQVGIGTPLPNESAQLDVVSSDRGVLIPRIPLTSSSDVTTITNGNIQSLLIFNTVTIADVEPGFYYWNGAKWIRIINGDDISAALAGAGTDDQNIENLAFDPITSKLTVGIESGTSQEVDLSMLAGGGVNIYNTDAATTGDRIVTQDTNNLTFSSTGTGKTVIDGTLQYTGALYGSIRTHDSASPIVWTSTDFAIVLTEAGISGALLLPDPTQNEGRILAIRNNAGVAGIQFASGSGAPVNLPYIAKSSGYTFMSDGVNWHPIGSR